MRKASHGGSEDEYHWLLLLPVAAGEAASRSWRLKVDFQGTSGFGFTTEKDHLVSMGKFASRPGCHIEYRRSGTVGFTTHGIQRPPQHGQELEKGALVDMILNAKAGTVEFRKNGSSVASFIHSEATPILGMTWYPFVALEAVDDSAMLQLSALKSVTASKVWPPVSNSSTDVVKLSADPRTDAAVMWQWQMQFS